MKLEKALVHVLEMEGGWSDHPDDPGGATNLGITHGTLKRALDRKLLTKGPTESTRERLKRLTPREAKIVYRHLYWQPSHAPMLGEGLDLLVFDAAVNQGVTRSTRFLQKALGVKVDGVWGPQTQQAALRACSTHERQQQVMLDYAVHRGLHYSSLSKMSVFGKGWFRRLFKVYRAAIEASHHWSTS